MKTTKTFVKPIAALMLSLPLCAGTLLPAVAAPKMAMSKMGMKTKTVTLKAHSMAKGAAMPKLRGMGTNTRGKEMPAPPAKGGKRTKDLYFSLHMDNRTGYYIRVYVDSNYRGTMAPWGDLYLDVLSGPTSVHCSAPFSDGTTYSWDNQIETYSGTYTIRLND